MENPTKDRQRFVDTIILIPTLDWSNRLSNLENVVETLIESVFEYLTMLGFPQL